MRKILLAFFLLVNTAYAQQFSLSNTRTFYDTFENPSQRAFNPDSSRQFGLSIFPTFSINLAAGGPVKEVLRNLIFTDSIGGSGLLIGEHKKSRIFANMNAYLFMFKGYTSSKGDEEIGVSWQVRSDNEAIVTNESAAIFDNYNLFKNASYSNLFNNKAYSQSYHQISFTYRRDVLRDYERRMGFGMKFSYISGIVYQQAKISESHLDISSETDYYNLYIKGRYRTNVSKNDSIGSSFFLPGFKNPGFSFTYSMNYKFRLGWSMIANLKDLGFIHWNKNSYEYLLDRNISISNASSASADNRLLDELNYNTAYKNRGFTTLLDSKAEVLIAKDYDFYKPHLLLSKSLFYKGGDAVFVNRFTHNSLNLSLSTGYNTSNIVQVGGQFMIKNPNTEFFIGSDQVFKSISYAKALIKDDQTLAKGYPGASFYFGFSTKFGYVIERRPNANRIPGFNTEQGFFGRLAGKLGIR